MPNVSKADWQSDVGGYVDKWAIRDAQDSSEGLSLSRYRWNKSLSVDLCNDGCIISVFKGSGFIHLTDENGQRGQLFLNTFVHIYVPPCNVRFQGVEAGTEIVCLAAPTAGLAVGKEIIVRDEQIMTSEIANFGTLRWTKTGFATSRRLFLRHDKTLLTRNGYPISWHRITASSTSAPGLPNNVALSKMSYNNHTEMNIVYETRGDVQVRMAMHPYAREIWTAWHALNGTSCYFLDETEPMAEQGVDNSGKNAVFRNKHELTIGNGEMSAFCMFDPGLCGVETHTSGTYSAYGRFSDIADSQEYKRFLENAFRIDAVSDSASLRKAQDEARRHLHESSLV